MKKIIVFIFVAMMCFNLFFSALAEEHGSPIKCCYISRTAGYGEALIMTLTHDGTEDLWNESINVTQGLEELMENNFHYRALRDLDRMLRAEVGDPEFWTKLPDRDPAFTNTQEETLTIWYEDGTEFTISNNHEEMENVFWKISHFFESYTRMDEKKKFSIVYPSDMSDKLEVAVSDQSMLYYSKFPKIVMDRDTHQDSGSDKPFSFHVDTEFIFSGRIPGRVAMYIYRENSPEPLPLYVLEVDEKYNIRVVEIDMLGAVDPTLFP